MFIDRSTLNSFGERVRKPSGESVVYVDDSNNRVVKVKDPYAKDNLKGHAASDALYEHIVHNLLFPNTQYRLIGISDDSVGDVRFVLEQDIIRQDVPATQADIDQYLTKELGLTKVEKPYLHYENDYYSITDVDAGGDNVLIDEDGAVCFIDPIIKFKRPAVEVINHLTTVNAIAAARAEVDTNPTEGQKKAGNYKKGHVKVDGYDITIENPKGSVRSGVDPNGKAWEQEMHNDYGYILGTVGFDKDHLDIFLSDDPTQGNVYVVDQVKEDGTFDEHKVMYGFPDAESARQAYLSNYEEGWKGLGAITPVSKEEFKKWVNSSHRKTKPFSEYRSVETLGDVQVENGVKGNYGGPVQVSAAEQMAIGGAMVDQLRGMGMEVNTDITEMRRVRKQAEQDNSEAGKMRHYRTPAGKIYGFSYRGKVYLDPRRIDAELPIHEYAHPWCEAFRKLNPEGWAEVMRTMQADAETWELVQRMNPDLKEADEIAEEMIALGSGQRGRERAEAEYRKMRAGGNFGNVWNNIVKAIQDFWKQVGDFLNIKYESAEQVYDQVVRDFAAKVNPRARVEEYLKEREAEYEQAVESGDVARATAVFNAALREEVGNGMTPFVAVGKYNEVRKLAKKIKTRDPQVVEQVAEMMAGLIPEDAVLVPVPSHSGVATDMLDLAEAIAKRTGSEVADVLTSAPRASQYQAKKESGRPLTAADMGLAMIGRLPEGKIPVVIDNVVDSGNTAEACVQALGGGIVVSLGDSVEPYSHAATLKSAAPVLRDRNGKLVPLSKRFDIKDKYIGRVREQKGGETLEKPTEEQKAIVEGLGELMNAAGLPTHMDVEKGQEMMDKYRERVKALRAWHGSGADFDRFDHSHMGEGEGGQAYGWGTYVTEVEGIGKMYAGNADGHVVYNGRKWSYYDGINESRALDFAVKATIAARGNKEKSVAIIEKNKASSMYPQFNQSLEEAKDLVNDGALEYVETRTPVLYEVEIPDDNGSNYLDWVQTIPKRDRRRIADAVRGLEGAPAQSVKYANYRGGWEQLANMIEREPWAYQEVRDRLEQAFGGRTADEKRVSDLMHGAGFVGVKYPAEYRSGGRNDGAKNYVIFDEGDLAITEKIRYHKAENGEYEPEMKPTFYSNAERAVEGIKQEKATPEQWLKMVEKAGGLKAGEDKWFGLSDWLKESEKKSLTKQEVLDYIRAHRIEVEEVRYAEGLSDEAEEILDDYNAEWEEYRKEYEEDVTAEEELSAFEEEMLEKRGEGWGDTIEGEDKRRWEELVKRVDRYNDPSEEALKTMVERYGDDFGYAFEVDYGRIIPTTDYADNLTGYAKHFLGMDNGGERPINEMRLNYTTYGLANKREIALTVEGIEPWNEGDDIHFGDAGEGRAVAWVRFGETTDADDNRVLVIDEIQSKRHQEGREKGYKKDGAQDAVTKANMKRIDAQASYDLYVSRLANKYVCERDDIYSYANDAEIAQVDEYKKAVENAEEAYEKAYQENNGVPDAPFDKNWHEVAMKRMLRYAAENGYDKVAWTTGEQQAERYDLSKSIKDMTATGWTDYSAVRGDDAKEAKLIAINTIDGGEYAQLLVNKSGKVLSDVDDQFVGKQLSDVVGKDLSKRLMEDGYQTIEGDGLRIGGEGMKGFYDQMLPRFMDKYVKKWGTKTGEVQLPDIGDSGLTMHAVEVTPEMKVSVMEGQPMFFKGEDGEVLGFTLDGEIYIDPRYAKPDTPVHEYTHLWAEALRKVNPKAWGRLKEEMRRVEGGRLWEYVKRKYPELKREDEIVEEVFAHYSGKRGGERLEAEMREEMAKEPDLTLKAQVANMFHRLRALLTEFWNMSRQLFTGKVNGLESMGAEDFADMALADLMGGFDPRGEGRPPKPAVEARDAEYLAAVERGDMETAQRMVDAEARRKGYVSDEEYRMTHTAPNGRDGFSKSIDDVTDIYPEDLYSPNGYHYYGDGNVWMDRTSANVFSRVRNNPEAMVKIYRAVPKGLKESKPRNGDWVSINREYAREHGERNIDGGYKIIEDEVPAKYVYTDGNSLHEQGYDDGGNYAYQDTKNNRKLLDAVTYDDQGNVIPLSKRFDKRKADIRYQKAEEQDIEAVNQRFNEELQQQIDGTLPKGHVYDMGMPSDVLLSTGFPNMPIELSASHLADKSKAPHHPFDMSEMKGLVNALQKPIAVFAYGDKGKAQNVIVEIQHEGKNYVVGIHFNQKRGSAEVSSIRGLYPKDNHEWLNWIQQGKALYLDKEKIQAIIRQQQMISSGAENTPADLGYIDLDSVAKIVNNFENPQINLQNAENSALMREGDRQESSGARTYDEALKTSRLAGYSKRQFEEMLERQERRARQRVADTIEKLNLSDRVAVVDTIDEVEGLTDRQREERRDKKGWYDRRNGRIVIILDNHRSVDDITKTIMHEGVAHHGLRALFGSHFDTFLDNVYENAEYGVRQRIVELAKKHRWDIRTATEEYLAGLAEDTNFDIDNTTFAGWWTKIKQLFFEMLHKLGVEVQNLAITIGDNELRYLLWRSYQNLVNPGRYRSLVEEAEDVAMQWDLGIGGYEEDTDIEGTRRVGEKLKIAEPGAGMKPEGRSMFGNIYDQLKGKAKESLAFLKVHHSSDMVGVFSRGGWGDVDLILGVENGGAEHILSKHVGEGKSFATEDEAMEAINDIIKNADKVFENGDRTVSKVGDNQVAVRKNWPEDGKKKADKNWLLPASRP